MRSMLAAFAAIIILSVGAGFVLNEIYPRSGVVSDAARLGD